MTVYRCPPVSVYTEEWVSDMLTNNYRGQKQQDALINEKSVCLDVSVYMRRQEVRMLTGNFLLLFIYIYIYSWPVLVHFQCRCCLCGKDTAQTPGIEMLLP